MSRSAVARGSPTVDDDDAVPRARSTVADAVFGLTVAATAVCYVVKAKGYGFAADDWRLAQRGRSLGDLFEPYNDHLSVVPIVVYRVLFKVFGLRSHLPLSLIGIGCGAAIAVALYLLVRSRVGPLPGLVVGASMLWYPGFLLVPAGFNHYVALTAVVVCAWLLPQQGPRADLALGLALTFALCSSGVGVAGAAGCLAYLVLSHPSWRRWLAVGIPTATWLAWWLLIAGLSKGKKPLNRSRTFHFVLDGVRASFEGLVAGSHLLGLLLAVLFVGAVGWRLRNGPRGAAQPLAWSGALVFWWIGLSVTRGLIGTTDAFRYRLVGSAFVILALLPERRPRRLPREADSLGAIFLGVVLAGVLVYANHGTIFENARNLGTRDRRIRQQLIVANLGPAAIPDTVGMPVGGFVPLKAGDFRHLVHEFGAPAGTRPADPDAVLVEVGGIRPVPTRAAARTNCVPIQGGEQRVGSRTFLRSRGRQVVVQVRRFEPTWVTIGPIRPGTTVEIDLPRLNSQKPWIIRAIGGCRTWDTTTSVVRPLAATTLKATTQLLGSTTGTNKVDNVEFHLRGPGFPDRRIGTAVAGGYVWGYAWNTSSVPNGRYTLTSVASNQAGNTATSQAIAINVAN